MIGQQLGDYVIERLLGVGGMAYVYEARDVLLGRNVAVKALAPAFLTDSGYVERFRREAQRVAALEHPHIAPILQFIEQGRGLYVVMPLYVESLRDRLERDNQLASTEATRIVSEIGSALAAAHAHGLIHRDVKPENILLDAQGHAMLADFGIARQARAKGSPDSVTLAGSGLPVGTPEYMPPEQLRGADLDQRADIYALGVVLYEMLTGRTPHGGNSPFEVAAAALTEPIIPPSRLNAAITPRVEAAILRALSMRAADRYTNVMSFVEALQTAATAEGATHLTVSPEWRGKRVISEPRPTVARPQTGQRQHAWWLTLGVLALALLVASGGGWVILSSLLGTSQVDDPAARSNGNERSPTATAQASMSASATASSVTTPTGAGNAIATPGATPTGRLTPTPSATTPGSPTATLPPPPPLSLSPLHLTRGQGSQCAGSQTISNSGALQVTWQWITSQPGLNASLVYGINTTAQFGGFPADLYPGVAPGGMDILAVRMDCTGQSYAITLRDGFGRTQQFTMISDKEE